MSHEEKIEKMIKEYRFTVVALSLVIVGIFVLFSYTLLVHVPDVMVMAIEDYFSTNEFYLYED